MERLKSVQDGESASVNQMAKRSSEVQSDGTVVLTYAKTGSTLRNLFRRAEKKKVILLGDNRVPFLALYQVT